MPALEIALWDRLSPRRRRWVVWLTAAVLAYTLIGFFLVPAIVKWQLLKQLPAITKRQAAVRQVKFNPYALSLSIRGLSLTEPDGRPFASWEEFYVNFQASSLFRWQWTFQDIRLVAPFGEVMMFRDGRLNFANMFATDPNAPPPPPPKPGEKAAIPRIGIHQLVITNGAVAFEDQTLRNAFRTEYRPINLHLTGFTTRPDADSPYSFEAEGDSGRRVAWSGNLTVEPLRSAGTLEIAGIDLSRFQPYLEGFTHAHLTNGIVDLELAYRFEAGTNGTDLVVTNMSVHGREIALHDPATHEAVAKLSLFGVTNASLNLRERLVRLGSVKATEAALITRIGKDGRLNLLELLKQAEGPTNAAAVPTAARATASSAPTPASPAGPAAEPWTIEVGEFGIERAAVSFEDLSLGSPFRTELKPIEVTLKQLTTRRDSDAAYAFAITTEAAESLSGEGTFSINPVRSGGAIKVAGIELRKYLPYVGDSFRGTIAAGKLDLAVPYHVAFAADGMQAGVSNLAVRVSGLEVKAPEGDETVVQVGTFALEDVGAVLANQQARVGKVKSADGHLVVRRGKDGSFNLLGLLGSTTNAAPGSDQPAANGPATTAAKPGWTVAVDEVDIQNYAFKIEDQQPARAAAFLLDQFALNVRGFSTQGSPPLATRLSARLNEKGTLALDGNLKLDPLSADMGIGLERIDLSALQPYLEQQARVNLVSGELGLTNRVRYEAGTQGAPQIGVLGKLWLTNLVTTDQVASKELLRWDAFTLSGVDLALTPNRLKLDEVKVQGLKANLIINPDRTLNVATLSQPAPAEPAGTAAAPAASPSPAAPSPSTPAEPFPVEVGALVLENVGIGFTDQSLQPAASVSIGGLSGSVRGVSSAMNTTAEVDLAGKIDDQAPFGIKGRVNPLAAERLVDLEITNRSTQLTAFTPYTEKYLGHPLNKGRLTLGLKYQIQGQQLRAENRFEIDQLMLGPRNQSPDATSLPVKLGVALLKDQNGRIELEVPIEGKLDDPEFRIGGAVMKVIANLIIKAAASPFSLLGKLVGGGEELSFLEFVPGTTNLVEGELAKLEKLSKALTARPAVNLEIEGLADRERDRDALALAHLQEQVRVRHWQSLKPKAREAAGDPSAPLEPGVYEGALRAVFVERFGTNLTAILQTNALQAAAALTNHTAGQPNERGASATSESGTRKKKGGLFGLGLFGGGSGTKRSVAEKGLNKSERAALDELTPDLMEALLVEQTPVSDDEMRQLMSARARWVQDRLLEGGAVTAERLFLVAPKPIPAATRGESRVDLSLN